MRLLITTDTIGGVWSYTLTLAAAVRRVRPTAQVQMVSLGQAPSPYQTRQAAEAGCVLTNIPGKLEWMTDPWADLAAQAPQLQQQVRAFQPNVLHLNHYAHTTLPWHNVVPGVAVVQGAHSCVNTWWQAVHGSAAPPAEWGSYTAMVRAALHAADVVVAPSNAFAAALQQQYGHVRMRVLSNGIDSALYHALNKQAFVLAAGRLWDEAKNLHVLVQAALGLPGEVQLAGANVDPDTGQRLHFPNVRLLGQLNWDAMAGALARAAVFAHPARYEPFGLSILEAAASGCALVLSDIPTLRELWDGAAIFLPTDDPVAWHKLLASLLPNQPATEHWGRLAHIRSQAYASTELAARYLRVVDSLRSNYSTAVSSTAA